MATTTTTRCSSPAEGAEAKVDVRGSVDGYAPVALTGSTQPFLSPPDLDLILTFDGVDMALLTPYSGTYAGRAIERGLLNLHLEYKLEKGKLQGDNSVVFHISSPCHYKIYLCFCFSIFVCD